MDVDTLRTLKDINNTLSSLILRKSEEMEKAKQPDPMAEWKALEPGRKVLSCSGNLYEIIKPWNGKELVGKQVYGNNIGYECDIHNLTVWQIIPLGPFDGRKLKVGDWVWVEGLKVAPEKNNRWRKIVEYEDNWIKIDTGHHFKNDGAMPPIDTAHAYYYPPSLDVKETEEERICDELSKDKAFVAHAIKVVSGELKGVYTCPLSTGPICLPRRGQMNTKSPCYALYGEIDMCPCAKVGEARVRSDLIKIISKAAGV